MDKMWKYFQYYLVMAYLICAQATMYSKFKSEYFYPHMVDHAPNNTLMVSYDHNLRIKGGTMVYHAEVANEPRIKFSGRTDCFYTLCMAHSQKPEDHNPDHYKEWDHWLVVNIPGSKIDKGTVIMPYNIPKEARAEGMLPYVFVLYEQPDSLHFNEEINDEKLKEPGVMRIKTIVRKYNLIGPLAGNYFNLRGV